MRIPRYWAKGEWPGADERGRRDFFTASGWSFSSLEEARREATARAKRIFEAMTQGKKPDTYDYLDRPLREEILEEIGPADSPIALITRNRYGAMVLNSANVLFADVDFPPVKSNGLGEMFRLMFSRKARDAKQEDVVRATIDGVERWAAGNPSHSFRLYRTHAGLRMLFTGRMYEPTSEETTSILRGLNADPMYIKLTQRQECFRARLTSKPWRCGCTRPPKAFPWDDAKAESSFRNWERTYTNKDSQYKTCDFINSFGPVADEPAVRTIVDVHDRGSRIESQAPLA